MIALPGVAITSQIYESAATLVYRGVREQDRCAVIAKVLKQDYPSRQELTRYRQEYEITRSLNIEGVIKVYSQQDYQRTLVILLEDFGGESLAHWMRQQSDFCPMPLSTFLRLAINLTETLGRIHAANVIHKDINPGNIVLNQNTGVVKIIDFGIATRFSRTNPTFKSLHLLEGTLAYLSPEQTGRMNRLLDYRTDFYSLGATFYELLTGQLPFPTDDILELVHCHIAKPPVPPQELNSTIPTAVSDLILKLMAKNAEDRYQSAWGIKADLERCAQQLEEMGQIDEVKSVAPTVTKRRFEFVDQIQLGLQDISEQFHIPQKLYGREAEIGALLAAFERVAGNGEELPTPSHGEMMLVSGYAGIGKSALVQELYKPITAKQGYFISGKFDQFGSNIPYSAIVDALKKLVQQLLGEPDKQVQQWRTRLLTALGGNGQIIIDVIPEVELIIGKQPPVPEVGVTEAQNRFNLIFQKFVRVFCSKAHPLAIFLDDLQWIDSATLKLIELILLDEQTQFLFLIGTYRDNEVHPTHPLVLTLSKLRKQGVVLHEMILTPLTLEPLSQLMAETLYHNPDTVRSLAQLVFRKTEGNPFFVGEFLRMLYSEHLLNFDVKQLSWQWDIAKIEAQNVTDNVVELLLLQLKKLPEETQQILCLAACVGSKFDLDTLAIVLEKSPQAIFQDLLAAIQAGLIQPLSELDENLLVQEYKFLHDRVQQAAYALIDESQKQVVHLQIGRNLLKKTAPEQLTARLFEIVDHLNQGMELVITQAERTEIARLNLMTGEKALAATAYEAALKYCKTGIKLLNQESWHSEYDLTLALYSEAAKAAYLSGHFNEMEQFVEVVLNHAKTVLDQVQVYDSIIQRHLSQGNPKSAIDIGLKVLQLLGVNLIETPSQLDVQRGLESTASLLAGREIEDLINLPKMTATEPRSAIYILANIGSTAFMVSPALMVLIVCRMVDLSINYGNATWSPMGYAGYGVVLCGVVQDIELGYKFGQLAISLVERLNSKKGNAKALAIFSSSVMPWKVHFRKTIPMLVEAYQTGIETGDFEFAGHAVCKACFHSFFAGKSLTELEQETATYSKAIRQIRREIPSNWIAMLWQTILNLLGRSENPSRLIGSVYDEEEALSHTIALKHANEIHYFYLNKVILCYLFGDYHQAAQTAVLAKQYVEEQTATMVPLFCFYHSLVLLSLLIEASSSEKAAGLNCVNTNQEKLQKWAAHAPMNYLHKFHLVEAEKARVFGQFLEAEELYEQAIAGAKDNEFIQEDRMTQFLEAIPVGVGIVDAAGRPYYANQRAIELVGKGVDPSVTLEQLTEAYQTYVAGTNQKYPTEKLSLFRALRGERTRKDDLEIHRGNTIIPVEVWGTPVFDAQGNVAYAIATFQDITERKQAEQLLTDYNRTLEQQVVERTAALQHSEASLRHREQELRLIADALPALISYVDANRRYQFINHTYELWYGQSREQILGKQMHELLGETVYPTVEPFVNQVLQGQTVTFEAEIPLAVGQRYISATLLPDFDSHAQVRGFYGLITDISDRKRAEEASILEERNRMAREIHDTLAQSFTGIVIHARAASSKLMVNPQKAQANLAQVQNLARTGLFEARRSVEALRRPHLLEKHDLLNAFQHLATQLAPSTGTRILCEAIGSPYRLPSEVENNLLRIGQEAITNALKYAQATEIRVALSYQPTHCTLRIKDDGQGFKVDRASSHKSFGLLGMAERAESMGAQFQIQSNPGSGTQIVVSVNQEQPL